jgi:hypothetical protein
MRLILNVSRQKKKLLATSWRRFKSVINARAALSLPFEV